MNKFLKQKYLKFMSGNIRTVKLKKNILGSFFVRSGSIIIGFIMIPIVLNYLDQTRYGIWLTLASFLEWFGFFDIGLGAGLRNKLAESLAHKNFEKARTYISTTYGMMVLIFGLIGLIISILNPFIDWTKVLNTPASMKSELSLLALIVLMFFLSRFILKLIQTILLADQRTALSGLIEPIGKLLTLATVLILTKTTEANIIYLGTAISVSPVLILLLFSIYLFGKDYKHLTPSYKYFDSRFIKPLLSLGIQFFFIRIASLILTQTSRIIIAQYFGPEEVIPFHLSNKYFSIAAMLFTILITPLWSAHTEAYAKGDISWIKNTTRKLVNIWGLISIFTVLMLIFSNLFFKIWVGSEINVPFKLSLFFAIYFILFNFGGVFNMFINGVGKIRLQLYSLMGGAILFLPMVYLFISIFKMGIEGLVVAMIIANIYSPIIAPIQYYKIINNKDTGIWTK